jgi:hypothetical protein
MNVEVKAEAFEASIATGSTGENLTIETYEVPGGTKWYWALVKSEDGKQHRTWARDLYSTPEEAVTAAREYDKAQRA